MVKTTEEGLFAIERKAAFVTAAKALTCEYDWDIVSKKVVQR